MNMKIAKIKEAELQITKLVRQEKAMRREYLADGTIDPKEQKQLDGVTDKMGKLKGAVAKIRAEIEAARRIWEGHAADYAQAKAEIADLAAWGHADHPKVKAEADKIDPLTADEAWEDATKQLDALLKALAPVMKDYEAQQAAKSEYEPLRRDTDARVKRLEAADPQTPDVEALRTDLASGLDAAAKSATSKDFVAGLKSVQAMQPDLTKAEEVARDARTQKAEFDKEWSSAGPRVTEAISCVPPEAGDLESKRKGLETGKSQIEEMLTRQDYAAAIPLSKDLGARSDAYMGEYAAVVDAKTLYEKRLPRIDAKLAEITKCQFPDLTSLQQDIIGTDTTMRGTAGTGGYEQALKHMNELDVLLVKFDEAYEAAKLGKDFTDRKAKLAPRIDKAKVSGFGPADEISQALTSDAEAADKAAGGKKYDQALALLDDVEVKLGDYETKRSAQEKAQIDYQNGFPQVEQSYQDVATCEYPQLSKQVTDLMGLHDTMLAAADKHDFVLAVQHMDRLEKALGVLETTLDTLRGKQAEYEKRLPPLVSRFDASMVSDFATLVDEREALTTKRAAMESAAKNRDFPLAIDHMNGVEHDLNILDAELGKIEGLKKQYEDTHKQIEGDLKTAGDCAFEELKTPKAAIVALRTEMLATAQEEDFAVALEKAKALIPLLTEFNTLMVQVEDYRRRLEVLKLRLDKVKAFTYKSLKKKQEDIVTLFGGMTGDAAEGKMTVARTKMDQLEKLVTDIMALNEELKLQEAVYKKLSTDLAPRLKALEPHVEKTDDVGKTAKAAKGAGDKLKELGDTHEFIQAVTQADVVDAKLKEFAAAVDKVGDDKEAYEILAEQALAGYGQAEKQAKEYKDLEDPFEKLEDLKKEMSDLAKGDSPIWKDARAKAKELLAALEGFRASYVKITNREAAVKAAAEAALARFDGLPKDAEEKAKYEYPKAKAIAADLRKSKDGKDFDATEDLTTKLTAALDTIAGEMKTKEEHKAEYKGHLASLQPRITKAMGSPFKDPLSKELEAVNDAMKAMTGRAEAEDYEGGVKEAAKVEEALRKFDAAEDELEKKDAVLAERNAEIQKDFKRTGRNSDLNLVGRIGALGTNVAKLDGLVQAHDVKAAEPLSQEVRTELDAILEEIDKQKDTEIQTEKDKTTFDKVKEVGEEVLDKVWDKAKEEAWDVVDSKIKGAKHVGQGLEKIWDNEGLEKVDGVIDVVKGVDEAVGLSKNVKRGVKVAEEVYDTGSKVVDYLKEKL